MLYIDKYAYISAFKDIHPSAKLIFGLTAVVSAVCSSTFSAYALIFSVMLIVTVFLAKIPLCYFLKLMALPLGFLVLGVIGVVIDVSQSPSVESMYGAVIGGYYFFVTKSGVTLACGLVLKSLSAVSCLYFIILTTPVRDITHILHRLKCPDSLLVLTILTYRFIFILMEVSSVKLKSQQLRHGYDSVKTFNKSFGMLFGSVFVQSFIAAEWVHKAMLARGCDGGITFLPDRNGFNRREVLLVSAAIVLTAAVVTLNIL